MVMSDVPKGKAIAKCYLVETDGKYSLNQRICVIRSNKFDVKFLYYHLNRYPYLLSFDNGENQTNLRKNDILNCPLYVPSIPEQEWIVAIVDQAFEAIDGAIENTKQNLANACELFESSLHSIFHNQGKDWDRLTLLELLDLNWILSHLDGNHGGDYPKKDEFVDSGIPYISANCIKNESVDMSLAKYLTPGRAALLRKGIAQNNDILFAHNAMVGPVAILHTDEKRIVLSTSLTHYRCDPKRIIPEYLASYMRSNEFKSQYKVVMGQSTRNQVPITMQRTFITSFRLQKNSRKLQITSKIYLWRFNASNPSTAKNSPPSPNSNNLSSKKPSPENSPPIKRPHERSLHFANAELTNCLHSAETIKLDTSQTN